MTTTDVLSALLRPPTPESLRALQADLLALTDDPLRADDAHRALALAGDLHDLVTELAAKLGARDYSRLASWLDIGAVGAAALEGLTEPGKATVRQIGLAALSEGLMVVASRQYVKAWSRELEPLSERSAWRLREALWTLSADGQPALAPDERASAVDAVLAPAVAPSTPLEGRLTVLARLTQLLVLIYTARACGADPVAAPPSARAQSVSGSRAGAAAARRTRAPEAPRP